MYFSIRASAFQLPSVLATSNFIEALTRQLPERKFSNYDASGLLGKSRHLSAATKLLCSTAAHFMSEPENKIDSDLATKVGVYVASDTINLEDDFDFDICARNLGPDYVSPLKAPNTLSNVVGSHLARIYNIQGPNCTIAAGHHSWYQGLDLAQLALQAGTIKRALLSVVEVSSIYQQLCGHQREMALIVDVVPHQHDEVRFSEPLLGRLPSNNINRMPDILIKYLASKDITCADLTLLTSETLSKKDKSQFSSILINSNISKSWLCGNSLFGEGEAASGGCAMLIANELLKRKRIPSDILACCEGKAPDVINNILVLSVDQQGAYSAILMEGL